MAKTGIKRLQREEKKRQRQKLKTLDKYVIFSIAVLIIFTICERTISAITGMTADTLTTCFYAAFGGEILSCCLIKLFKLKNDIES